MKQNFSNMVTIFLFFSVIFFSSGTVIFQHHCSSSGESTIAIGENLMLEHYHCASCEEKNNASTDDNACNEVVCCQNNHITDTYQVDNTCVDNTCCLYSTVIVDYLSNVINNENKELKNNSIQEKNTHNNNSKTEYKDNYKSIQRNMKNISPPTLFRFISKVHYQKIPNNNNIV